MIVRPIDYFLVAWFVLCGLSTMYVAWDQFRNNPEPPVMKWGFVLMTLYMGPLGLLLYVLADKEPRPGTHEEFTAPLWKQGVGSTVHCVAGDATGIILAAVVTATLGLAMKIDLLVEYAAAPEHDREDFVFAQITGWCDEYRFGGLLGFGGKFRRRWERVGCCSAERWYVDAYPEDVARDPSIGVRVNATNAALAGLLASRAALVDALEGDV